METHIFTVYDSAAGMYLEPFICPSIQFALREFGSAANAEGHQFNKFPADYTLFYIGTFDPAAGKVDGLEPTSLAVAVTLVQVQQSLGREPEE